MKNIIPVIAIITTVFFWGSSFPVMSFLLETSSPMVLGAGRFVFAAFISILWCAYNYNKKKINFNHLLRFFIAGFVGIFLYNIFLNYGQQTVSAGASSFIVNCNPLFTALIGFFILKQRVTIIHWAGLILCLIGVSIISIDQEGGFTLGSGATLILFAAILTATYFHILKPLVTIYGSLTSFAYTIVFGTLPMVFWFPETYNFLIISNNEVKLAFLWLAIFPTALGYLTWTFAVGYYGANKASLSLYLIAPISLIINYLWYDKEPSLQTIIGGLIIITSLALTFYIQNRNKCLN
ncbi:DMT family transporter [Alphaproteobacteria bacterium]|nr:DMT family transporter [Alphaproteobacteria bacterium]